jgi:hypothetical protein
VRTLSGASGDMCSQIGKPETCGKGAVECSDNRLQVSAQAVGAAAMAVVATHCDCVSPPTTAPTNLHQHPTLSTSPQQKRPHSPPIAFTRSSSRSSSVLCNFKRLRSEQGTLRNVVWQNGCRENQRPAYRRNRNGWRAIANLPGWTAAVGAAQ